jgi:dipeptidyl aminopeptidase/acylaminoacyl peptidase
MMTGARNIIVLLCMVTAGFGADTAAGIERFKPREGNAIEVWRITNDPTVRDHANYHNMQCWSPDGRYLCFTHYASDGRQFGSTSAAEVHVYDLHEDKDIKIDKGTNPRWANEHNWLFYLRYRPAGGPRHGNGTQVMWRNVETGQTTRIGYGIERLKYADCDDRWLYGYGIRGSEDQRSKPLRVAIAPDSTMETLPGDWQVGYNSLMVSKNRSSTDQGPDIGGMRKVFR